MHCTVKLWENFYRSSYYLNLERRSHRVYADLLTYSDATWKKRLPVENRKKKERQTSSYLVYGIYLHTIYGVFVCILLWRDERLDESCSLYTYISYTYVSVHVEWTHTVFKKKNTTLSNNQYLWRCAEILHVEISSSQLADKFHVRSLLIKICYESFLLTLDFYLLHLKTIYIYIQYIYTHI